MLAYFFLTYRVPKNDPIRGQWINAISTHQAYDLGCIQYPLCQLHFRPSDIIKSGPNCIIKIGNVPSIFPDKKTYIIISYDLMEKIQIDFRDLIFRCLVVLYSDKENPLADLHVIDEISMDNVVEEATR